MKALQHICIAFALLFTGGLSAQDALTMQDINFATVNYNTAFFAEKAERFSASLTNTSGGGIQNTGQVNFLAYTQLSNAHMALGARVNSKYFGLYRTTTAELSSAKRIQLNSKSSLMAGINVGMQFTALRSGELNEYVDQLDPILVNDDFPQYRFVFGLGLGYVWNEKLRAGISLPSFGKTESDFNATYIANVSYDIKAGEKMDVSPEVLFYGADVSPFQAEINAKAVYNEFVWVKAGYRTQSVFVAGLGIQKSSVSIGYMYNAYFQEYQTVVPAAHHINLSFRLLDIRVKDPKTYQ